MATLLNVGQTTYGTGTQPWGPFDVSALRGLPLTFALTALIWSGSGALATLTLTFDDGTTTVITFDPAQIDWVSGPLVRLFVDSAVGTNRSTVEGPGRILRGDSHVSGMVVMVPAAASTVSLSLSVAQSIHVAVSLTSP